MNSSEKIVAWIWDHRWMSSCMMLALAAMAGLCAMRVGVDNSVEIWFLKDDSTLKSYQAFQRRFGNDESVLVAFTQEGGILDDAGWSLIQRVTIALEHVEGVDRVISLANVPGGNSLLAPDGKSLSLDKDPFLVGRLISEDGQTAVIHAIMAAMDNMDVERPRILARIKTTLDDAGMPYRMAGTGVIYDALNQEATVGASGVLGLSYLVIVGFLWVFLRRLGSVVTALGSVGIATLWAMGLYGAAGRDINMVTMVIPTLILIVGLANSVHILMHVARLQGGMSRRDRVIKGVGYMVKPCLFNSLTTAGAFLSLWASPMAVVKDLGTFAAAGLVGAFISALVVCTIALSFSGIEPRVSNSDLLSRITTSMARLGFQHPVSVLVACVALVCVSIVGISHLRADTYSIGLLFSNHPVRMDSDAIERDFGPYTPLEVLIKSETEDLLTAQHLLALDAWQSKSIENGAAGWAFSIVDGAKRTRQLATGNYMLPQESTDMEKTLAAFKNLAPETYQKRVEGKHLLRATFGITMGSAREMEESLRVVLSLADFPGSITLEPTGYIPLYVRMMEYVVTTQIRSFAIAFIVIFILIALLFRDVKLTLLALPSNLLPAFVTLGVMGYAGIRLDVATVTIAALVLGLVVDDTVHFLYQLQHELQQHSKAGDAAARTVRTIGHSMMLSSLVLIMGFSVLGLAQVKSVNYFGLLCALAMISAIIADLVVVPALVKIFGESGIRSD
jgi:predicted RND superfamily exporter protein